ncbi:hypothetical protein ACIQY5_25540 [Peribacillus frigoritolerans]|uniref:hypothetical protein n=1 Tax=Peribacillus frigoritolerans TaxID=450367 RepID=UPI0038010551
MFDLNKITFQRTDISIPGHIESFAKEFADHFIVRRSYVPQFCKLIQTSKFWNPANLEGKLSAWVRNFSRTPGRTKIIDIITRSFKSCQDKAEIDHLRGAMVEALVIGFNGGTRLLAQPNYGWGARVDINLDHSTIEVRYICTEAKDDKCHRRSTVDFGSWDGRHGKFYECKAHPFGIGCKEVRYMEKLKSELIINGISHEIFFVCAESTESIQMKLDEFDLGPLYKAYGMEEIQQMMPA